MTRRAAWATGLVAAVTTTMGLGLLGAVAPGRAATPTVNPIVLDAGLKASSTIPAITSQVLKQPDGTSFKATKIPVKLGGGFETPDGYSIARNGKGQWVYATTPAGSSKGQLTNRVVGASSPDGLTKHALRSELRLSPEDLAIQESLEQQLQAASRQAQAAATAAGQPRIFRVPALMLATWYDESKGQTSPQFAEGHDAAFFKKILTGFGGNPRGTVTEFYFESSFHQFLVEIDVYGPYTSARSVGDPCYYGRGDGELKITDPTQSVLGIGGVGALGMAIEGVPQAGPDVTLADPVNGWGKYDNDGDGTVDFTIMIHSGSDAASTGNMCFTWSHAIAASSLAGIPFALLGVDMPGAVNGLGIPTSTPGKFVNRVVTIPESSSYTSPLTIGVAAHEMAHALGEPDYYDTGYTSTGTGDFDVMSGGSYYGNPAGSDPTIFNPATRVAQGWVTPTVVHGNLKDYTLRPRNVMPTAGYAAGTPDPNLLLIPTYEVNIGDTDSLGHVWDEADVKYLAKDPANGKYIVEGFYVEYTDRMAKDAKINPATPRGTMFDRQQQGSGILAWHFDYWVRSSTDQGYSNNAQSVPTRYQMDLLEFDRNGTRQDLQTNYSRGNPGDYLAPAATGITSGTFTGLDGIGTGSGTPQGKIDFSGSSTPTVGGTSTFVVDNNPGNASMTVSITGDGDCKLSLTDPSGRTGAEADAGSVGGSETISVQKPMPGTWTANIGDYAACTQYTGTVTFASGGLVSDGILNTFGASGTWSNWSTKPTGWALTNVRGSSNGTESSVEAASDTMTLDVMNFNGTVDVSPGFITGTAKAATKSKLSVPIFSNGSVAPGKVTVALKSGKKVLKTTTVTLGAYERKTATFTIKPKATGPLNLSVVVDPKNRLREASESNQSQATLVWVGSAKPKVLIVDDDGALTHERAIAGALASLKIPYAITGDHPSAAELAPYQAVVWSASLDRAEGQLDAANRAALTSYLDKGGKLLVMGNRIFDALGMLSAPQNTAAEVDWMSHYLGARGGSVVSMEQFTKGSGVGVLGRSTWTMKVPPGRPFVTLAQLTQNGANTNGATVAPFGAATGVAAIEPRAMVDNGLVFPATDPGYLGVAVNGDAAHKSFKTVTLGWNIGDNISMLDTRAQMQSVMKFFGVKADRKIKPTKTPLIFLTSSRDSVEGVPLSISAFVVGEADKYVTKVSYRAHGASTWTTVTMKRMRRSVHELTLPASAVTSDGVEYFVRVYEVKKNGKTGKLLTSAPYSPSGKLYYPVAVAER